jgi:hypothetical protein
VKLYLPEHAPVRLKDIVQIEGRQYDVIGIVIEHGVKVVTLESRSFQAEPPRLPVCDFPSYPPGASVFEDPERIRAEVEAMDWPEVIEG